MPTRLASSLYPATTALWDRLDTFAASRIDEALAYLMDWFRTDLDVDDVLWLGCVLMLDEREAAEDAFQGWRIRVRRSLLPDTAARRQLTDEYFAPVHRGRLNRSFFVAKGREEADVHIGAATRALLAGSGKFRAHRLRDGWVDYARFRRTEHYRLYYENLGIADRIWVACPLNAQTESVFLLDRHQRAGVARQPFTDRDTATAAAALGGRRDFHRRLLLSHGVFRGVKTLSPVKQRILQGLLTGLADKEIAGLVELRPLTLRKYITELYGEYGVKSRAGLMALWLGEE